jgi:hypothetical protein
MGGVGTFAAGRAASALAVSIFAVSAVARAVIAVSATAAVVVIPVSSGDVAPSRDAGIPGTGRTGTASKAFLSCTESLWPQHSQKCP